MKRWVKRVKRWVLRMMEEEKEEEEEEEERWRLRSERRGRNRRRRRRRRVKRRMRIGGVPRSPSSSLLLTGKWKGRSRAQYVGE